MPVIDAEQRTRECDALMDAAVAASHDDEARAGALRACVAHPCAYHELDLPELYRELGETLCRLERYDESLEAWEAAIAAGDRGLLHPRTTVAEVLLRAGRREETDLLFADLRHQCPDEIWLYNAAGFAYALVGEHAAALPWLEEGIAMSLADGDREGIVHQLDEERTRCREALGLCDDELTAQVAAFERPDRRPGASIDEPKTEPRFAAPSPSFPTLRCRARWTDRRPWPKSGRPRCRMAWVCDPAGAVSWATAGLRATWCPTLAGQAPTFAHVAAGLAGGRNPPGPEVTPGRTRANRGRCP